MYTIKRPPIFSASCEALGIPPLLQVCRVDFASSMVELPLTLFFPLPGLRHDLKQMFGVLFDAEERQEHAVLSPHVTSPQHRVARYSISVSHIILENSGIP